MVNLKSIDKPIPLGGTSSIVRPVGIDIKLPDLERTIVINFDNLADATIIDQTYADQGVTFASLTTQPASRGSAYARRLQFGNAQSGKNVLSLSQSPDGYGIFFDARQGAVEATFVQLQPSVSVWAYALDFFNALGSDDNRPFMEAFDASDNFLGRARTELGPNDSNFFLHWLPITFISTQRNIKKVRLSSQAHGANWVGSVFDNLTYHARLTLKP